MKKKKSILLLIAMVLGVAYLIYIITYFSGAFNGGTDSDVIAAGLATVLVGPHIVATAIAVLFNALGYFLHKRGFALTGGILYIVAGVLFIPYIFFVVIQAILSFIGYAKMQKE